MDTQEMAGKVAIVTGASSGIGRATAIKLASQGAHVALVARTAENLQKVESLIRQNGGQALSIPADVAQTAEVDACIDATARTLGGIDILVNAAGILGHGGIEQATLEQWDRMMTINVRSMFYIIQKAIPFLVERKGCIVNVSSVAGLRAYAGMVLYCVSKAAVDQLTHCVALDMASKGVRCNAVNSATVASNIHFAAGFSQEKYAAFMKHSQETHPLGRVGQPEDIAELIYFLASPRASWITGVTYPIDGGRSLTMLL